MDIIRNSEHLSSQQWMFEKLVRSIQTLNREVKSELIEGFVKNPKGFKRTARFRLLNTRQLAIADCLDIASRLKNDQSW